MGKFDGKQITGVLGNHVIKKAAGGKGSIIQMKPVVVKQTAETKKAASVMGNASTLSAAIRRNLGALFVKNYQGTMINQLNKANQTILGHCFNKDTETYSFQQDSFHNLEGFEFNTKSPLAAYLWVQPTIALQGNTLTLTIPAFEIPAQIKIPKEATGFAMGVQIGQYALHESKKWRENYFNLEIADGQTQVPEQQISFEVQNGCLCVVGLGIQYHKVSNQYKTPLNHKDLNPAAIVGTIVTPGDFVEPAPLVVGGRHRAPEWTLMDKLKLKKGHID